MNALTALRREPRLDRFITHLHLQPQLHHGKLRNFNDLLRGRSDPREGPRKGDAGRAQCDLVAQLPGAWIPRKIAHFSPDPVFWSVC